MIVRLRTLGSFSVELDGVPRPDREGQPVRSALLLLLALDRDVTREGAMALLWPESDDDRARQALRQTLYLLRGDLGSDWLGSSHDSLHATAQLAADAHELVVAAGSGDHERVTALYQGSFLPGVRLVESQPFQLWCDQWSSRLERLHRQSRRIVIDRRLAAGDLAGSLETTRQWLEVQPLEDEAQHRALELLARLGRGDEALREFDAYCALLAREGLGPLDQTKALVEEIRAGGRMLPALGPVGIAGGGPAGERGRLGGRVHPRGRRLLRRLAPMALVLIVAAVLFPLMGRMSPAPPPDPRRIMVLPLENETGDPALDDIGLLTADWITQVVAHMGSLQTVPFLDVRQMLGAGMEPDAAAALRRAGLRVSGRYFRAGDSLELHVRIVDVEAGELWHALAPVRIEPAAPESGLRELQDRVAGSLSVRLTPASALPRPAVLDPPGYHAFRAYMDAAQYIIRRDWAGALPHIRRAAELDTTFYRARLGLVTAHMNLNEFARADSLLNTLEPHRDQFSPYERVLSRGIRASLEGDRAGALAIAREAARIDPGGTTHYISAGIALAAGHPREAVELYLTLDPDCLWAPEWTGAWADWTAAWHLLGDHRRELEEARRARTLHPDRLAVLFLELRALVGLGRLDALAKQLAEAGRMAPDPEWDQGALLHRVAAELRAHDHAEAATDALSAALEWYDRRPPGEASQTLQLRRLHTLLMAGRLAEAEQALGALRHRSPHRLELVGLE
ncbi:MAG: tetratricopeptide repeat protein, partial [Gemmatimonadota bacterium]